MRNTRLRGWSVHFKVSILPAVFLGALCSSRPAAADASSWLSVGGGPAWLRSATRGNEGRGLMQLELGMGSSPASSVVVGGVLKTLTFFGRGTDVALAVRGATGGLARGDWGLALDVGPFQRWWGPVDATGIGVSLALGMPFGIQASAVFEQGNHDARALALVVGIDLMRMSVYRTASLAWVPNPLPSPALRQ